MMVFNERILQFKRLYPEEKRIHFRLVYLNEDDINLRTLISGCLSPHEIDDYGHIIDIDLSPYANINKYMHKDTKAWIERIFPDNLDEDQKYPVLVIQILEED